MARRAGIRGQIGPLTNGAVARKPVFRQSLAAFMNIYNTNNITIVNYGNTTVSRPAAPPRAPSPTPAADPAPPAYASPPAPATTAAPPTPAALAGSPGC